VGYARLLEDLAQERVQNGRSALRKRTFFELTNKASLQTLRSQIMHMQVLNTQSEIEYSAEVFSLGTS
jgi:hypothetical protein